MENPDNNEIVKEKSTKSSPDRSQEIPNSAELVHHQQHESITTTAALPTGVIISQKHRMLTTAGQIR